MHTCLKYSMCLRFSVRIGTKHSRSCFLRCVIKQHSAFFNVKTINSISWIICMRSNPRVYVLQHPANFSIFMLLSVNEHKPTSMSLYCVPLLAEESVFQRLSIKSQCQIKSTCSAQRERECFLLAFPFGIYNEEQHALRWVFPVGASSQSFLPSSAFASDLQSCCALKSFFIWLKNTVVVVFFWGGWGCSPLGLWSEDGSSWFTFLSFTSLISYRWLNQT